MPSGDRTGPEGCGPITGRGLGYCAGNDRPGYTTGFGQGIGYGRGRGMGRRFWRYRGQGDFSQPPQERSDELSRLRSEVNSLKEQLRRFMDRLGNSDDTSQENDTGK